MEPLVRPTKVEVETVQFENGDTYVGGWSLGLPHGEGTYTWSDGSEYSGQWKGGQKSGVGRYKWPSGATYQGEWVDGMMQGVGTFEALDGTMYTGSWLRNRKHGLGKKVYANQDCYEGLWQQGKSWGPGRYMWVDGNEYDGEWANGVMHGQGTFVWRTGERYDGEWRHGLEHGQGIFTWADGSSFDGFWSKGRKHGVGLYRTAPIGRPVGGVSKRVAHPMEVDRQTEASGSGSPRAPNGEEHAHTEAAEAPLTAPPLDRRRYSTAAAGGAASAETMFIREYDRGKVLRNSAVTKPEAIAALSSLIGENLAISKRKLFSGKAAKVGETIHEEHRSYELMLDLQLGVRWSVSKVTPTPTRTLAPTAVEFAEKVKVSFPREGSKETPPHPNGDFRWKDYCPMVFRKLRVLFGVDPGEYMLSICSEQALRELSSPGKSGALFYISHDDRFLIKTMRRNEMKTFLAMLPRYYEHIQGNPHTLVTKFFGLYRIKLKSKQSTQSRKIRFIVMGNIFNAQVPIHAKYDLKGSTQGRATRDRGAALILKDLDLDVELALVNPDWAARLERQLGADTAFLRAQRVMDYSLLMGIHYKDREQVDTAEVAGQRIAAELAEAQKQYMQLIVSWGLPEAKAKDLAFIVHLQLRRKHKRVQAFYNMGPKRERADNGEELAFRLGETRVALGAGTEATARQKATGKVEDAVVFFGIIDFLQEYNTFKRAEHALKAVRYDGTTVSVVDPTLYAKRFTDFILKRVFVLNKGR